MGIKAVGTITENLNDGKRVKVDWTKVEPVREWYFYTHRATIWRVLPGEWMNDALIGFAFDGKPQDIDRFRNEPFWRERYGTTSPEKQRFEWTDFYEAVAEKLLAHADDRTPLIEGIHEIASQRRLGLDGQHRTVSQRGDEGRAPVLTQVGLALFLAIGG